MKASKTLLFTSDTLLSVRTYYVKPATLLTRPPACSHLRDNAQCNPARASAEQRDAHFIGQHFASANYFQYQWTDVVISGSAIKWTRSREFHVRAPAHSHDSTNFARFEPAV